jgi:1-acyl-sn-glycerol-3-phosphate acyltransferase
MLVAFLFAAFFLCLGVLAVLVPNLVKRRRIAVKFNTRFCRIALAMMKVKIAPDLRLQNANARGKTYLIVANHLSYLDILAISTVVPAVFVTSVEIRDTFFLGALCKFNCCEFVERRSIWNIKSEIKQIAQCLQDGFSVTIFPESTTSNGSQMIRFKSSLIETAVASQVDVLPICLNYKEINGRTVNADNRDLAFWYGDMEFFPHLLQLLTIKSMTIGVQVLEELPIDNYKHRKHVTRSAFEKIEGHYLPVS